MSYLNNRALLRKADMALADLTTGGGLLKAPQAQKFMRLLIKESTLLKQVTVTPMRSPKEPISQIKFGQRILRPGRESTPLTLAQRSRPDFTEVELDAQLLKGEIRLPDEALEDNIERGQLRQTIMELASSAIRRDMEELVINGDTASADPYLAVLDGVLKQARSNIVDAAGASISRTLLRDMLKALPSEHAKNKKALRFYTSVDAEIDYRHSLAGRATAAGDRFLESDAPVLHSGVPLAAVPLFPENLGPQNNQTAALLCHPKNIRVGMWRNIKIEYGRDISAGQLKIVVTLRMDVKFAEEAGVAKLINLAA